MTNVHAMDGLGRLHVHTCLWLWNVIYTHRNATTHLTFFEAEKSKKFIMKNECGSLAPLPWRSLFMHANNFSSIFEHSIKCCVLHGGTHTHVLN